MRWPIILAALLLAGCFGEATVDAPAEKPVAVFEGLPLSGNKATALAAGYGKCLEMTRGLRCRKDGITLLGVGPLSGAVDLDREGDRFDRVTLWHDSDQSALIPFKAVLEKAGWKSCLTAEAERFWKPPSPLRIAMDTSYWGKRRLVISAPAPDPKPYCPLLPPYSPFPSRAGKGVGDVARGSMPLAEFNGTAKKARSARNPPSIPSLSATGFTH